MTRRGQGQDTETKHHHSMKQQNQQCIQHCSHCHVHSTYTYSITNICCCLCSLSVTPQIDMSNQLCLCKYNKECGVESVIYSAIWFRSNLFYSAFFGRISVNLFGMPVPDIPWVHCFTRWQLRVVTLWGSRSRPLQTPDPLGSIFVGLWRQAVTQWRRFLHPGLVWTKLYKWP